MRDQLPPDATPDAWRRWFVPRMRVLALWSGSELVGVVAYHRDRLHLAIAPQWRGKWFSERIGRQIVAAGLDRSPRLVALVGAGDTATQRIAAFVGFKPAGEAGAWQKWILERAPHGLV